MKTDKQIRKVKCPHCGWVRTLDVTVYEDELLATVVAGRMSDALRDAVERVKGLLADPQLDEANAWVDMPPCPHCQNVYQYNVRSGKVRP